MLLDVNHAVRGVRDRLRPAAQDEGERDRPEKIGGGTDKRRAAAEMATKTCPFQKKQRKWEPPDKIVENDEREGADWPFARMGCHQPANGPKNLASQPDSNDR